MAGCEHLAWTLLNTTQNGVREYKIVCKACALKSSWQSTIKECYIELDVELPSVYIGTL
jgi:hypothetical protein